MKSHWHTMYRRVTFQDIDPKTLHIIKRNLFNTYAEICASLHNRKKYGGDAIKSIKMIE